MKNNQITLICTPLRFYSRNDEDLLFAWLKKITCITSFKGIGRELHLYIPSKRIKNNQLLDLMGLFQRYKFDTTQLTIFKNKTNEDWFTQ